MDIKYLTHIYKHLINISSTVVIQSNTVELLYKYKIDNVYGLEVNGRYHGGKTELHLKAIGGKLE